MKEVIGHNLKSAREAAQLSQEQLARKLGISRVTLSAIENGHAAIDSTKLLEAARILGRPVSDFFNEKLEETALLYRAAENAAAPDAARHTFERFCRAYRELEEILEVAGSVLPPPEYHQPQPADVREFASLVANSERLRLDLGQIDPIENLFKLLDELGVRIFLHPLDGHEVFGMSAYSAKYGACVFLNASNTLERQLFSLAHEYGHLLMHRPMYRAPRPQEEALTDQDAEVMANVFAAHFLVPGVALRAVFHRDIGQKKIGIEDIVFLKRYFRVSAQVIYRRLVEESLIKDDAKLQDAIRGSDPKKEIAPLQDDLVAEWLRVQRFEHLAKKASLSETISLGKLAELLGETVLNTRRKVQQWQRELSFA